MYAPALSGFYSSFATETLLAIHNHYLGGAPALWGPRCHPVSEVTKATALFGENCRGVGSRTSPFAVAEGEWMKDDQQDECLRRQGF